MAETNLISSIEELLNKKFSDKKISPKEIINKYEKMTGDKFELDDVKEEILNLIIYAKDKVTEFVNKTAYSVEKLEESFKKISNINLEKSLQVSSNNSIELIRNGFSKMNNTVMSSTKNMFTYGTNIIKGFFSDISKKTESMVNSLLSPIKNMIAKILVPFKMIGSFFSNIKTMFSTGIKGLFGDGLFKNEKEEKDEERAGITRKVLGETLILKRTSIGIAISWLWKQMNKSGALGTGKNGDSMAETVKDSALAISAIGGVGALKGFLKKFGSFALKGAGTAGGLYSLWNVSSNAYDYFNETDPEKKETAGKKTLGSGAVTTAAMSLALIPGVGLPAALIVSGIANALMTPEMEEKLGEGIIYVYNGAINLAKDAWEALPTWEEFKITVNNGYNTYIREPLANFGEGIVNWLSEIKNKISSWWDSAKSWWDELWKDSKTIEQKRENYFNDSELAFDLYKQTHLIEENKNIKDKSNEELYSALSDLSISEADKEASFLELQERKNIDKNINESVIKFSETISFLIKPLKEFSEEMKSNSTSFSLNFFSKIKKSISDTFSNTTKTQNNKFVTPLNSENGSVIFEKGRLAGKKFENYETALAALISKSEGDYSSVNRNDMGAGVSLGFGQWNSGRARDLLLRMQKLDPEAFKANMGENLVKALNDNTRWGGKRLGSNPYVFSKEEKEGFSKLASREDMQKIQIDKMLQDMSIYFEQAKKQNITDVRAQMFFSDLQHQYGFGGAKKLVGDAKTLEDMLEKVKYTAYRGRRYEVYNDLLSLKELEKGKPIIESPKVEPVKINSDKNIQNNRSETLTNAISELTKFVKKATENKEVNMDKTEKTDNSTVINNSSTDTSDKIPKQIMDYVFGVNAGGNDTLNILGAE